MKTRSRIIVMCVPLLLASCGAKKAAIKDTPGVTKTSSAQETSRVAHQLAFVQKVNDQKVYANNIVADMSFTAQMGDRRITVPGAVHMRRDEVIRLQMFIPLLGSEVGRLEFTPDYVLVIDRMHKQYVKGDYNQLDFLRNNGLNFYSLQALFWNQLLLPGASNVGEGDLHKFRANLDGMGQNVPVSLQNGNMDYVWEANRKSGIIGKTSVTYNSAGHGKSNLVWEYTDFSPLGVKLFPATQEFSFTTSSSNKIQEMTVRLKMKKLKTSENWETRSTVSPRYKEMDAKFIFDRLLNM